MLSQEGEKDDDVSWTNYYRRLCLKNPNNSLVGDQDPEVIAVRTRPRSLHSELNMLRGSLVHP